MAARRRPPRLRRRLTCDPGLSRGSGLEAGRGRAGGAMRPESPALHRRVRAR